VLRRRTEATQAVDWDKRRACFDKLSMRFFLNAMKILPHPELVEGRTAFVQSLHI